MNRRDLIKSGGVGILALLASAATGCDRQRLITWAGIVVSAFEQSLPILKDILPSSVALVTKALEVAKELKTALESGSANAVDFIEQLIAPEGLFNQILDTIGAITDPNQRKIISGILMLAGVALRLISAGLQQGAPQIPKGVLDKAEGRPGASTVRKVNSKDVLEKGLSDLKF